MRVKLYMAQTLNAKIARKNGEEDFLSSRNWQEFKEIAEEMDAFAIGRRTYEEVKTWEEKGFEDIEAERIVVSKKEGLELEEGFTRAHSPKEAIQATEKLGVEGLLVTGGASLNTSFIQKDLIDEIILNIEPYLLGEGINLFSEEDFETELELLEIRKLEEEIVQLHYGL